MKRTRLRRSTALSPGTKRLRRTAIKRVGKRKMAEAEAEVAFRTDEAWRVCEGACGNLFLQRVDAHHICSRARGAGHPLLHDPRNRAWLCRACHDAAHRGELPHLIRSRDFLDTLT